MRLQATKYRNKNTVKAFEIGSLKEGESYTVLIPKNPEIDTVTVDAKYVVANIPVAGGFYVENPDGFQGYMSREMFVKNFDECVGEVQVWNHADGEFFAALCKGHVCKVDFMAELLGSLVRAGYAQDLELGGLPCGASIQHAYITHPFYKDGDYETGEETQWRVVDEKPEKGLAVTIVTELPEEMDRPIDGVKYVPSYTTAGEGGLVQKLLSIKEFDTRAECNGYCSAITEIDPQGAIWRPLRVEK